MRRRRLALDVGLFFLPVLAVWGLPLLLVATIRPAKFERDVLFPRAGEARYATVGERRDDGRQAATVELTWSEARTIVWGLAGGVVTDVSIAPDSIPQNGTILFSVDGIGVISQVTGQPIYRDIVVGMAGEDVNWLDGLLVFYGFSSSSTLDGQGRASDSTARAVKKWQTTVGEARPDGIFRRKYVLYVGEPALQVGKVHLQRGDTLAPGSEVLSEGPQLQDAHVTLTGPPERQGLLKGSRILIRFSGLSVELSGLQLGESDLDSLQPLVRSDQLTLDNATVERTGAIAFGTVPASAVVVSVTDETRCVLVAAPDSQPSAFPLNPDLPSANEPGVAYVDEDLVGKRIITNPSTVSRLPCV